MKSLCPAVVVLRARGRGYAEPFFFFFLIFYAGGALSVWVKVWWLVNAPVSEL